MKTRIISLALVFSSLLLAVSCGSSGTSPEDSTAAQTKAESSESVSETGEETRPALELPEDDFEGYEFRILEHERDMGGNFHYYDFYWMEDLEGEMLNDEVRQRNFIIEERYNCTISAKTNSDVDSAAKHWIAAGDDMFDVYMITINTALRNAYMNYYVNFYEIPYVRLNQPWWDQNMQEELSLFGKMYCMTGDISIFDEEFNSCICFNKVLAQQNDLPDFYGLARDGKWTVDQLMQAAKTVSRDVNGDGVRDENDSFGILYASAIWYMMTWCDAKFGELDADGIPYMTVGDEKQVEVAGYLKNILEDRTNIISAMDCTNLWDTLDVIFLDNRGLFRPGNIHNLIGYRSMEADFGILPCPKYDENQQNYAHLVLTNKCPAVTVPTTNTDLERTGIILEALAYESQDTISHTYYERNLEGRLSRDSESEDMLDIIFTTKTYDIALAFDWGGIMGMVNDYENGKNNYASGWAEIRNKAESELRKTLQQYEG